MLLPQETIFRSLKIIRHTQIIRDVEHIADLVARLAERQKQITIISWVNAHTLTVAQKDSDLATSLLRSTILLRDGVGISVLFRLLGRDAGVNLNGTDWIPRILRLHAGRRVALLGSREPSLSKAAEAVEKLGCRVALRMDGFQEPEVYTRQLVANDVDVVVLGMGVPKQHEVAHFLANNLVRPVLILNGGAILDFMADRFPRAPKLWRRLRLEWLFRLTQEPRRLWRRYTVGGVLFLFYTAQIIYAQKYKLGNAGLTMRENQSSSREGTVREQKIG
jgi:exopolysaccharide biosynthesis WecB/TagA/CpsF family protein